MKTYRNYFGSMLIVLIASQAMGQVDIKGRDPQTVGIFLYDGIELLDFSGPGEVLAGAGFQVFTVSINGDKILSQDFLKVLPDYSIANAPIPDIAVFPGGGPGELVKNETVLNWISKIDSSGSLIMSVCNGASFLARANILDRYSKVTTHHNAIKNLQARLKNTTVLSDTRFVDNGDVITTAGISAGIDGALHLVSRIRGFEAASQVATIMEYDRWNSESGLIEYHNRYLEALAGSKHGAIVPTPLREEIPFLGEFINLAESLRAHGEFSKSERVINSGLKFYPGSELLYAALRKVYNAQKKPVPVESRYLVDLIENGEFDKAFATYQTSKQQFPTWTILEERPLVELFGVLRARKDYSLLSKVVKMCLSESPESLQWNFDMAETYSAMNDKSLAKKYYAKSLELAPQNILIKERLAQASK